MREKTSLVNAIRIFEAAMGVSQCFGLRGGRGYRQGTVFTVRM